MSTAQLEKRLASLEAELARLRDQIIHGSPMGRPWWRENAGRFANDPIYDEAMRLGRAYRESTRPKVRKRKNRNDRTWRCAAS